MPATAEDLVIEQGKTFQRVVRWETTPAVYKAITAIPQSAPVTLTVPGHGIPDGWKAAVIDVKGMVEVNALSSPPSSKDFRRVTVVDADTVQFNEISAASFKPYRSGGYLVYFTPVTLTGFTARMTIKDRIGVAMLTLISLVALFLVHRQGLALTQQQALRQRRAQAENQTLEAEVALRTAELVALAQHLQTAREDERARLARDLHDELGALLTAAKLDAARIRARLAGTSPDALERLAHLVAMLDGVIALKRSISENLHPSSLYQLGLVPTLQNLAAEFSQAAGIPVHCTLQPVQLPPGAQLMVFRLVQESITNISKYARARQVWLALHQAGGQVRLEVRDDGDRKSVV